MRKGPIQGIDDFVERMRELHHEPTHPDARISPELAARLQAWRSAEQERWESIVGVLSMDERSDPTILDDHRKEVIATSSGTTVYDVDNLLDEFRVAAPLRRPDDGD